MALINWNWTSPDMAAKAVSDVNTSASDNYKEQQKRNLDRAASNNIDAKGNLTSGFYTDAARMGLGFEGIKQAADYYAGQNAQNMQNASNWNTTKALGGDPGVTMTKTNIPVNRQTQTQQPGTGTSDSSTGLAGVLNSIGSGIKRLFTSGGDNTVADSAVSSPSAVSSQGASQEPTSQSYTLLTPDDAYPSNVAMPVYDKSTDTASVLQPSYLDNDKTGFVTADMRDGAGIGSPAIGVEGQGQQSVDKKYAFEGRDPAFNTSFVSPLVPEEAPDIPIQSAPAEAAPTVQAPPAPKEDQEQQPIDNTPWFYDGYKRWHPVSDTNTKEYSPDSYSNYFDVTKVKQTGEDVNAIPYTAAFKAAMGTLGQGSDQASVDALFKLSDSTVPKPAGAFLPGADGKVDVKGSVQAMADYKAKLEEKRIDLAKALQKGDADQVSTILGFKNLANAQASLDVARGNLDVARANLGIARQKNDREKTDFDQAQAPIAALNKAGYYNVNVDNVNHVKDLHTTEGQLLETRRVLQNIINHPDRHPNAGVEEAGVINRLLGADGAATVGAKEEIIQKLGMMREPDLVKAAADGPEAVRKWLAANGNTETAKQLLTLANQVLESGRDAVDAWKNHGHVFGSAPKKPAVAPKVPGIPQAPGRTPKVGTRDSLGRVWTGSKWVTPGAGRRK